MSEAGINISHLYDKEVRVKFVGGREVEGILKGDDALVNLVLDNAVEYIRDPEDQTNVTNETRQLGLIVCRGVSVALIYPVDGTEEIENPFGQE